MMRFVSIACALFAYVQTGLAEPVLSEFMADNESTLMDANGEYSDWIEVHNPSNRVIDLTGYYLTDDEDNLTKWSMPDTILAGKAFKVVFASGSGAEAEKAADAPPTDKERLIAAGVPEDFIDQLRPEQVQQILRQVEQQRGRPGFQGRAPRRGLIAPHTNFKLTPEGEFLALVKPDGKTVVHAFRPRFPKQRPDTAYGLIGDNLDQNSPESNLLVPTPGKPNSSALEGFVTPVRLSEHHGIHEKPFILTLSCATPETEIRFTVNGDEPSKNSGMVYKQPLAIGKSHIIRAAAFRKNFRASPVATQTFLFLDDVIRQSPNGEAPEGWPRGNVNGQRLDYGMNPEVVETIHSPAEVEEALLGIPSMSVVAPLESLFDSGQGIYVNASGRGREWERKASLELLPSSNDKGFQVDGGLRMRGGFSRQGDNPKHCMRFTFRKSYGAGKLNYPLFGDEGVDKFNHIDLRSSMNYSWAFGGGNGNTLLRDIFSRDLQRDMGQPYTRSRYYHLYLNGHYWGVYMTQERSEADYAASYLGGKPEDYDVVKTFGQVADGTREAYDRLYDYAVDGFAGDAAYFRVQGMNPDGTRNAEYERLVDVDNLIDYMLSTFYTGDKDGPGGTFAIGNNYYAIYNRENPDGFKFFEHDSEHSLGLGVDDMTDYSMNGERGRPSKRQFNPDWLHTRMAMNANYRQRLTERVEKHFFEGGALTHEAVLARLETRERQIDKAIIAHSARWGDASRTPTKTREDWLSAVGEIKRWIRGRDEVVLRQLYERGLYLGLPKPLLNRNGGQVAADFKLFVMESAGESYVTTDGSDPRGPDSNPAATAIQVEAPRVETTSLLRPPYEAHVWVPTHGRSDHAWMQSNFNDADWINAKTIGIGYDTRQDYRRLIGIDLEDAMHSINTTAYIRIPFDLSTKSIGGYDSFSLKMKYDDGFIVYLNGKQIAAANAPDRPNWRSTAVADHPDLQAVQDVSFAADMTADLINDGVNVLAIHGMDGPASSDFLIAAELEGVRYLGGQAIPLTAPETTVKVRSFRDGKWSPPLSATFEVTP